MIFPIANCYHKGSSRIKATLPHWSSPRICDSKSAPGHNSLIETCQWQGIATFPVHQPSCPSRSSIWMYRKKFHTNYRWKRQDIDILNMKFLNHHCCHGCLGQCNHINLPCQSSPLGSLWTQNPQLPGFPTEFHFSSLGEWYSDLGEPLGGWFFFAHFLAHLFLFANWWMVDGWFGKMRRKITYHILIYIYTKYWDIYIYIH